MLKIKLAVIILLIAGVGFYVYDHQKTTVNTTGSTPAKAGKTAIATGNPNQIRLMITGD